MYVFAVISLSLSLAVCISITQIDIVKDYWINPFEMEIPSLPVREYPHQKQLPNLCSIDNIIRLLQGKSAFRVLSISTNFRSINSLYVIELRADYVYTSIEYGLNTHKQIEVEKTIP